METIGEIFKPGDKVPQSGIYKVIHDPTHKREHEVTCIFDKIFPPCRGCNHPRFILVRAARHIETDESFN
jgi:hypothetical protein